MVAQFAAARGPRNAAFAQFTKLAFDSASRGSPEQQD